MPPLHTHIYIESVSNTHRSRVTSSISTNCEVYFTKPFVETRILGVAREGVVGALAAIIYKMYILIFI